MSVAGHPWATAGGDHDTTRPRRGIPVRGTAQLPRCPLTMGQVSNLSPKRTRFHSLERVIGPVHLAAVLGKGCMRPLAVPPGNTDRPIFQDGLHRNFSLQDRIL